jgi:AcrR family transcriptional regulator
MVKLSFREQVQQAREDAIVASVNRLLAEKGFDTMTVDEVVADVGIAKASLYKHFASKEDLAAAAMVRVLERALEACERIEADGGSALDKLKALARWTMRVQLAGEMPSLPAQNSSLRAALAAHKLYMDRLLTLSDVMGDWIEAAREAGFKSVSVDLIYGLPLQTRESLKRTLDKVIAIAPDRLALYNYAHLPTVFMPQRRINEADLPSASTKLDILQGSVKSLTDAGYTFIGMDHFAKPEDDLAVALRQGRLQRNFQGYSTHADCDMIGLGVSSIGKIGPCYSQSEKDLDSYYAALDNGHLPIMRGMTLDNDDILRRSVIQALMCRFSLSVEAIEQVHGINFADYFAEELPAIREYHKMGLLTFDGDFLMVEPKGRFLIRNIAMLFDRHLRERETRARYSKTI